MIQRGNVRSREVSGNLVIPASQNRMYFAVYMTGTSGTVEFGSGGGKIPLDSTGFIEPYVAPIGEISIECVGTYIVSEA